MDYLTFIVLMFALCGIFYFLYRFAHHIENKHLINSNTVSTEQLDAIITELKLYDSRINNTWSTINDLKQSIESIRLQVGLKGITK